MIHGPHGIGRLNTKEIYAMFDVPFSERVSVPGHPFTSVRNISVAAREHLNMT
jgi:hypothetical protein